MENITVSVTNYGLNSQINLPVEYIVNDNAPVNEIIPGPVGYGETIDYTFTTPANFATPGIYDINSCTHLTGDVYPFNDCFGTQVQHYLSPVPVCIPSYKYGCQYGQGITYFELEQIENTSGCDNLTGTGWSQYLDLGPAILLRGQIYDFTFQCSGYNTKISAWIDFNDDLILSQDERMITDFTAQSPAMVYTVPVLIPANALTGKHLLRLRTAYTESSADPCININRGEAEDYYVNIGPFGSLEGYVYEYGSTNPVQDAEIQISSNTVLSGADGYYIIDNIPEDMYDAVCKANGFLDQTIQGIQITGNNTTTQNFFLQWAELSVDPVSISVGIPVGEQTDLDIILTNNGPAPLNYTAYIEYPPSEANGNGDSTVITANIILDIDAQTACLGANLNGAVFLNGHFYVSGYLPDGGGNKIFELDMSGNLTCMFDQPTTSTYGIRDLLTNGLYIYGGDEDGFYCMDPISGTWFTVFTGNLGFDCLRGCDLEVAVGGIYVSDWSTSIKISHFGSTSYTFAPSGLTGQYGLVKIFTAPLLLIFDQGGTSANRAIIHEYDIISEALTGVQYQIPMLEGSTYQQAAGLFRAHNMFPGKTVIGGLVQSSPSDKIFIMEYSDQEDWLSISAGNNGTIPGTAEGNATMTLHFDATGLAAGTIKTATTTIKSNCRYNPEINIPVTMTVEGGITLDLKAFLEGPFDGQAMAPNLNTQNAIPLYQPYYLYPWSYYGAESVGAIPNGDIVDWMLVELRETTGGPETAISDSIIGRKAGFILTDGKIVGEDGQSPLLVSTTVNSNLYVVLWHQNHMGIMSACPLVESGGIYSYDFTINMEQVYGSFLAHKEIGPGIWGMTGGDGFPDGHVNNIDKLDVWSVQAGNSGYYQGDFNRDSFVNNADKVDIWVPNVGSGGQVPQ